MNKTEFLEKKDALIIRGKAVLLGTSWKMGILFKIMLYVLLVIFGFVFLYPLIYMVSYAFMTPEDVVNPFVHYLPTQWFYMGNFTLAYQVLNYMKALGRSLLIAVLPAILQCVSTSLIGYGLARFRVPGKGVILALVLATFIIPPQADHVRQMLCTPTWIRITFWRFWCPLCSDRDLKARFHPGFLPVLPLFAASLEEAAKIDGAGIIRIFVFIAVPLAFSGYLLTFLFSFVWYFNETTLTALFLGSKFQTLPLALESFLQSFNDMNSGAASSGESGKTINEAIYMAGTFLSILPLLIIYFIAQKQFVESVDKAGITANKPSGLDF